VIKFIRILCLEPYSTGHRNFDDEDAEEVGNNESFEGVLPHRNMGALNLDNGMKVKVCVSFENKVYPMSHVWKFINESDVFCWTVTFVGKDFTTTSIICDTNASWNEVFFYCLNKVDEVIEVVYVKVDGSDLFLIISSSVVLLWETMSSCFSISSRRIILYFSFWKTFM
jgi:hypothetical protein